MQVLLAVGFAAGQVFVAEEGRLKSAEFRQIEMEPDTEASLGTERYVSLGFWLTEKAPTVCNSERTMRVTSTC